MIGKHRALLRLAAAVLMIGVVVLQARGMTEPALPIAIVAAVLVLIDARAVGGRST